MTIVLCSTREKKYQQKYNFLRPLWFFENENFVARATLAFVVKVADFLELNS